MSDPIATGEAEGRALASIEASAGVWFLGSPHPFDVDGGRRVERGFATGTTIAEMLSATGFKPLALPHTFVFVARDQYGAEATPIPREFWGQVRPKAGVVVYARVVPGKKKNPLRMVMMVAIMVLAAYTGGLAAAALGGGMIGGVAGAVVSTAISPVGSMLVNGVLA